MYCMHKTFLYSKDMTDRLSRDAWVAHGLDVLRDKGHEALKADKLSKSLSVSRGSFYWHFPSLADFHAALLTSWSAQNTQAIIAELQELPEPRLQLAELIKRAKETPLPLENAMRRWAGVNPQVAAALEEVDQLRYAFLVALMVELGVPEPQAKDRAIILTWAFIGRSFAAGFVAETSDMIAGDLSGLLLQTTIVGKPE